MVLRLKGVMEMKFGLLDFDSDCHQCEKPLESLTDLSEPYFMCLHKPCQLLSTRLRVIYFFINSLKTHKTPYKREGPEGGHVGQVISGAGVQSQYHNGLLILPTAFLEPSSISQGTS